ncbi:MAG TPA: hypothetical protein VGW31_14320 [Hanamia sp.]|nr:hypothetical protein [Hanamia sp.]
MKLAWTPEAGVLHFAVGVPPTAAAWINESHIAFKIKNHCLETRHINPSEPVFF